MRSKNFRIAFVAIIITIFIFSNFKPVNSQRPVPPLGLKTGDTVTYILEEYDFLVSNQSASIASDDDTGEDLLVKLGASYDITVLNATPVWDGVNEMDYVIPVSISNGTHSVKTVSPLTPTHFYFSAIDWDYWEANITADPSKFFEDPDLTNFSLINGIDEFRLNSTSENVYNSTHSTYLHLEFRYNKTDGAVNNVKFYTTNSEIFNISDFKITFRRAGYDYNGTSIDTTTSNTTTTFTSTYVTPSSTETTYSGTTTLSDTITDTNTMMTTDGSLTTTTPTSTSTTTTRQLTSETKETTLVRTNSTSETSESPTVTLPVPAFGPIITFTGFMVILVIIRKKN